MGKTLLEAGLDRPIREDGGREQSRAGVAVGVGEHVQRGHGTAERDHAEREPEQEPTSAAATLGRNSIHATNPDVAT